MLSLISQPVHTSRDLFTLADQIEVMPDREFDFLSDYAFPGLSPRLVDKILSVPGQAAVAKRVRSVARKLAARQSVAA